MASGSFDITVDSTKVDSTLTNFPVMIYLSSSSGTGAFDATQIFTDLGANSKKVKVKNSSGTELYCEIEDWDSVAAKATLHVKVDSVSSSANTVLNLQWDSTWADNTTYIGDTGDLASESVWDANFAAVYHMNQDPSGGAGAILDSTSNGNDGTSAGSMTSGDLVDADYGKAIDFDGTDDAIYIPLSGVPLANDPKTIEVKSNGDTTTAYIMVVSSRINHGGINNESKGFIYLARNNTQLLIYGHTANGDYASTDSGINVSTWLNLACSNTANAAAVSLYKNGVEETAETDTITTADNENTSGYLSIGEQATAFSDGQIAEVRISNIVRSGAWIKATNETLTDDLLSLASGAAPATDPSVTSSTATEVNSRSAILQGSLTDLGGEASVSVYFEYGLTTAYGSTTDALTLSATGNFSAKITDFDESTTYHFRAVASDGVTAYNGADQSLTTTACPFQLTGTPSLESIYWSWEGLINQTSYICTSVVFDIADNWGQPYRMTIRQIDFYYLGTKITNIYSTNFTTAGSLSAAGYPMKDAFDTTTSKIGDDFTNQWESTYNDTTNRRLVCIFNTPTTFDEIRINNGHDTGNLTERGARNVVIHVSTDSITEPTYGAVISNSTKIFDGVFRQHIASNVEDEQILELITE